MTGIGWIGCERVDGMLVQPSIGGGYWYVVSGDHRPVIDQCPCCEATLTTAGMARMVADFVYPMAVLPVAPLFPDRGK